MTRRMRLRGFTVVEMLTVLMITGILAGLLFTGVMRVRFTARQRQCLNNMRQLAAAVGKHEFMQGRYPGSRERIRKANGADVGATWIMSVFPYMGQQAISDRIRDPNTSMEVTDRKETVVGFDGSLAQVIANMRCGADPTLDTSSVELPVVNTDGSFNTQQLPETSYVASGGFLPKQGLDPGRYGSSTALMDAMNRNNGLFHDLWRKPSAKMSLDMISDGASNTVMLSENLQATYWFFNGDLKDAGMAPGAPQRNRFATMFYFLYMHDLETVDNPAGAPTQKLQQAMRINGEKNANTNYAAPGIYKARPSSQHGRFVNMAFADGSTRVIHEDIAYHVYAALITPRGSKSDVPYRAYILNNADY